MESTLAAAALAPGVPLPWPQLEKNEDEEASNETFFCVINSSAHERQVLPLATGSFSQNSEQGLASNLAMSNSCLFLSRASTWNYFGQWFTFFLQLQLAPSQFAGGVWKCKMKIHVDMLHLLTHSVPLKWNLLLCVLVVFETAVAWFQVQTMQHLTSQTQDRHLHCQQLRLQHKSETGIHAAV